jgi:protein TonB
VGACLPFAEPVIDRRWAASWLLALLVTVAFHGVMSLQPERVPLQHGGVDEWRVAGTVRFVETPMVVDRPLEELKRESTNAVPKPKPVMEAKPLSKPVETQSMPIPGVTRQAVAALMTPPENSASQESESSQTEQTEEAEPAPTAAEQRLAAGSVSTPSGVPLVAYRSRIIELINAKKSYPRVARRRGIEGAVEVSFTVTADGQVAELICEGSRDIFEQSACETILAATPFPAPQGEPLQLSFMMDYVLD